MDGNEARNDACTWEAEGQTKAERPPRPPPPETLRQTQTQPHPQGGHQPDRPPPPHLPGAWLLWTHRPRQEVTTQSQARGRRDRVTPP